MTEGNPRGMDNNQSVLPRQPGEPSTNKAATTPATAPDPTTERTPEPAPSPAKPAAKPAVQSTAKDKE